MKNSKTCPKCGSKRIMVGMYDSSESPIYLRMGIFFACSTSCYICVDCGYIESWIDDCDHAKLKKRYERECQ